MNKKDKIHMMVLGICLFTLAFILSSSAEVTVSVNVEDGEPIPVQIPTMFSFSQVLLLIILTAFATNSMIFLSKEIQLEEPQVNKEKFVLKALDHDSQKIYKIVMEKGEIVQKEIVSRTQFSKSKVTRVLMSLEQKGLVMRRPHGNTNMVSIAE